MFKKRGMRQDPIGLSRRVGPVEVDDRGRIANWPDGFLDVDLHESQRLIDIMYGSAMEQGEDNA